MLTNTVLLSDTSDRLNPIDQQRRYLLRIYVQPKGCPCCDHSFNLFEARGETIDEHDFLKKEEKDMACPACKVPVEEILPLFGGDWHWSRKRK